MQIAVLASLEAYLGLPEYIVYIFVFVFGAAIGSFLNVVIHRVPNELSVVSPGSACPTCGKSIAFYDNIPILSWLMLAGKCRSCKSPIAWRYPAVELMTAALFVLTYWNVGLTPFLPVALLFVAAMLALIFIDAEHMILPNVITYPMLVVAIGVRILFPLLFVQNYFSDTTYSPIALLSGWSLWLMSLAGGLLGALVGGGSLWLVGELWKRLRGVDAMGLGDVKMMFGVGALIGWRLSILTIFIASFAGALIGGVIVMRSKDKDLQAQIPFGIFLGIGSIVALLFGEQIVTWYLNMFVN